METTEFPKSNSKWLFCNCINGLKNISAENKAFALEIFRNEYNISKRNSKKIIKQEKVELWMLLTLLLHMNLINDLSHLSLAQWVERPTNVWHPLASDITNITSSSNHYIPIEISQWCIFFSSRSARQLSPVLPDPSPGRVARVEALVPLPSRQKSRRHSKER